MSKEERKEKANEYVGLAKEQGKEFIEDIKNLKTLPKRKKRKVIVFLCCIAIVFILLISLFSGGYNYKNVEEFKEVFCNNIGAEYLDNEWASYSAEETGSYDMVSYDDGYGNVMISIYLQDDKVICASVSDDMRYIDTDTEFMWKCAAVSAMFGCDMNAADTIVREANLSGQKIVEMGDGIKIYPYMPSSNIAFFNITTERYE